MTAPELPFATRASLAADLRRLGLGPGDTVMVHAAVGRLGAVMGGPDTVIAALRDVTGPEGTIVAYTDWNADYEAVLDVVGRVPQEWRAHVVPFDPLTSRAVRDYGIFPEFLRTTHGAFRSGNPGASVAAIGRLADDLTHDHPLDYGYGSGSPLERLVQVGGKVLLLGAPRDSLTLLHYAEYLARLPEKRIRRVEVPLASRDGTVWRMIEEFETGLPVVDGLDEDYFAVVVDDFLKGGQGRTGRVGLADCVLVEAAAIVPFAVDWLETRVTGA
jgi:aminoglycoside 3-N-acetyltransferase